MISSKKIAILSALSKYKFLTRRQFARLRIEKYNGALSKHCSALVNAGWIGFMDARNYGIGHIYYLKKRGATFFANDRNIEINELMFCKHKPVLSSQSLHHRCGAIDCQIELNLACMPNEAQIIFYHRDIDSFRSTVNHNPLSRKTRISILNGKYVEPDAIFMLGTPKGEKLYCLEFENQDYTKKSFQKIEKHVQALNLKSVSDKFNHQKAHRTLFIYKNPTTMESIIDKVNEGINGVNNWFLFKSLEHVNTPISYKNSTFMIDQELNFFEGWRTANGDEISLY